MNSRRPTAKPVLASKLPVKESPVRSTASLPSLLATLLLAVQPSEARRPAAAPDLPFPDPGIYTIIEVDSAQELADACWNLDSDQAILIAPGSYDLSGVSFPNGVDGRLTVGRFGAPSISNIQIRGATGDPTDVIIEGAGMLDPIVPFGFQIFTATDVTLAHLSISEVYYHAVAIQGDQGARDVRLYDIHAYDAGQQIIKGSTEGADSVLIEYSTIGFTAGAIVHPEGSPPNSCYTNGIDATGGSDWIIRDNLITGIKCQNGDLAGPAILMWQGSANTLIERNTILDSSRGISLGLVGPADHSGGIVRNNFIRWSPGAAYQIDVPIYTVSPGSQVLHNTALTGGRYPNGVEVRFAGATDVLVAGNLLDAAIRPRDGANPTVIDNETGAQTSWFVDEPAGDLHLTPAAVPAIDQVDRHPDAIDDFEARLRSPAAGEADLGAAELESSGFLFEDGFEAGNTSAWSS